MTIDDDNIDIGDFWRLIAEAEAIARPGPRDGFMARFEDALTELLRARGPEAVVQFSHHFNDRMRELYHFDLWSAAYLIAQGCSDDGFSDFCCWLISMGKEVYDQALASPDSLAGPSSRPDIEDVFFEGLLSLPLFLYEDMTGSEIPDYPGPDYPITPPGTRPRDDGADLPERFPALWAIYGERFSGGDL